MIVRFSFFVCIVLVALFSLGSFVMTRAYFTDTVISASNTFTTAESFDSSELQETETPPVIQRVLITEVSSNGDEWVEIYNDSGGNINLDGWKIQDGSSNSDTLTAPSGFESEKHAVIVGGGSTVTVPDGVLKIQLSTPIGSGLNNNGDRLIITDDKGNIVETISWGDDNTYGTTNLNPTTTQTLQRNPDLDINTPAQYLNTWKLGAPSAGLKNN
ncbi:MAG TPA: lamin tail domain-containing protein [Candidatus Levybacteria bacterium]|nr:lamin tail domain-containing protein [Candidatus Levybacteria bacterium]